MASMASPSLDQPSLRPSFATVAASSYKPHNAPPSAQEHIQAQPGQHTTETSDIPAMADGKERSEQAQDTLDGKGDPSSRSVQPSGGKATPSHIQFADSRNGPPPRPRGILPKPPGLDDSSTQVSSSSSAKPVSVDGKSIASGTTFNVLDEKESLRPDDSASLRAVEEEDNVSPPGSNTAGSRIGSDVGGTRAFRDQLNEISITANRVGPPGRFPSGPVPTGPGVFTYTQARDTSRAPSAQPVNGGGNAPSAPMPQLPDEKLLEALASGRDRVWVLKLEQDLTDFMNNTKENEYSVPNCNSFYRMLAHRMADYFSLDHIVDDNGVKVSKTPHCRIPPPLSGFSNPTQAVSTPPLEMPARKIMRRGDDSKGASGTNTTANSEGPSKAASEVGGNTPDGTQPIDPKTKLALSREEREAKYKEVRQRIFGEAEPSEKDDEQNNNEGKDQSRSSSVAGKKKSKKQQRNYNDDGFDGRSQYNAYYQPAYGTTTYSPDNMGIMFMYPGMMGHQYPVMPPNVSPAMPYSAPYNPMMGQDSQQQYAWPQQNYQQGNVMIPYNMPMAPNYQEQLSNNLQQMQPFQQPPSNVTPQMPRASPNIGGPEQHRPQSQSMNVSWPQPYHQPGYQSIPTQFHQPNGSPQHQNPSVFQPYPYGQLPPSLPNGKNNKPQHPIPGSYNGNMRGQFNPQTQSFVPGGANQAPYTFGTAPYQASPSPMPYNSFQPNNGVQMPMNRPTPTNAPGPGPYQSGSANPVVVSGGHSRPLFPPQQQAPSNGHPQTSQSPRTPNAQQVQSQPSSGSSNSTAPSQSSIAKWSNPAAQLPAKPPPPASMQNHFMPGHPNLPGSGRLPPSVPAPPTVGPNGLVVQGTSAPGNSNDNGDGCHANGRD